MSARKKWRCFHCGDVFTRANDAGEHFGFAGGPVTGMDSLTGCQIKGHEHSLLRVIRKQEGELRRCRAEDGEIMRAMQSLQSEQAAKVREAEELGYGRGTRDMKAIAEKQFGAKVKL